MSDPCCGGPGAPGDSADARRAVAGRRADRLPVAADHAGRAFAPGGIADLTARSVAQAMSTTLRQPIVVDNKPSAGSIVGSQAVAQGCARRLHPASAEQRQRVSASLFRKLPFDDAADFAPVALLGSFDLALFRRRGPEVQDGRQLVADARSRPGRADDRDHRGRQHAEPVGRTVPPAHRARRGDRAVQGLARCRLTALRSGEIDAAFEIPGRGSAGSGEGPCGHRGDVRSALRRAARGADDARGRRRRLRGRVVERACRPAKTPPAVIERPERRRQRGAEDAGGRRQAARLGVRPRGGTPQQLQALLVREVAHWRGR